MINIIHPTAVIEVGAQLGYDNIIGPFCYIGSNVRIGSNNVFRGHCSIGTPPEHKKFWNERVCDLPMIEIGDKNVLNEFVTVNLGTFRKTIIRDNVVMLRGSHLSHDSHLSDNVTVSCNVLIGGETKVMTGANLGLGSIIHQRQVIGAYSMLGMGTIVTKKTEILPFKIYVGNPARYLKENLIGIERADLTISDMESLMNDYENLVNASHVR